MAMWSSLQGRLTGYSRIKTARADRPAGGRGRSRDVRHDGMQQSEQALERSVSPFPDREGRDQQISTCRSQLEATAPPVRIVDCHRHEAAPFQRLEIGGERGPVHGQQGGDLADAGRLRPVERHHQGELAVGQGERPERLVEPARQGARGALHVKTQAGIADHAGDFNGKLVAA